MNRNNLIFYIVLTFFLSLLPIVNSFFIFFELPDRIASIKHFVSKTILYETFVNQSEIDLLFIGSSNVGNDINRELLRIMLQNELQREVKLFTIDIACECSILRYKLLKEILDRRKVGLIIFGLPSVASENFDPIDRNVYQVSDHKQLLEVAPFNLHLAYLTSAQITFPFQMVKHYLFSEKYRNTYRNNDFVPTYSQPLAKGWGEPRPAKKEELAKNPFKKIVYDYSDFKIFEPFSPQPLVQLHESLNKIEHEYLVSSKVSNALFFKMLSYARSRVRFLAVMHMPIFDERNKTSIVLRIDPKKLINEKVPFLAISNSELFRNLSENQIRQLYFNNLHFNTNGANFFTKAIGPAIGLWLSSVEEERAGRND
jgi:hypothetical protein